MPLGPEFRVNRYTTSDNRGRERHVYVPGEALTIRLAMRAPRKVEDYVFGVAIFTSDGVSVYGTNTHIEEFVPGWIEGDVEVRLVFERRTSWREPTSWTRPSIERTARPPNIIAGSTPCA